MVYIELNLLDMGYLMDFVKNFLLRLDFKLYPTTWLSVVALLGAIAASLFLPAKIGYENGIIEDVQLVMIIIIFAVCIRANNHKAFFNFMAMLMVAFFLREISYGCVFFPVEGTENKFKKWQDIWEYGILIKYLFVGYVAWMVLYFIFSKAWLAPIGYLRSSRIPVIDMVLIVVGIVVSFAAELKKLYVLEESFELLFYFALLSVVYLYSSKKEFQP
jgi:hypothetical protein